MLLRLTALLGLVFLSACATITTSPSQDLTVLTEPPGADCRIERNSNLVATLEATPGQVRIGNSTRDTTVACAREGYTPAQAVLTPRFQPMLLGNALAGGVVGVIVDVSTGAAARYPDTVQMTMIPTSFASPEAKAAYFTGRSTEIRRAVDVQVTTIRQGCRSGTCDTEVAEAEASRDRFLTELEDLRQKTP
ncbi:hypothetical protein [Roseomonas populi]|uniref:PEGA domain-containing protein n=1 Tax=Roseomonas populi TaxID=3121582 RepID=A0ABT1X949_9PROT|nr:hypothetical protein [Roseomonas pecuniae]MCR0984636.1 hypothetical protein [Roseomonas pecuniae]